MARICISCIKQEIFASTENFLHETYNYISETDMGRAWGAWREIAVCCIKTKISQISPYILGISMERELNEKVLLSSDICIEPRDSFL